MNKFLLAAAVFLGLGMAGNAQVKIAHIDTDVLMEVMPEAKKAKTTLENFAQTFQTEFDRMKQAFQTKVEKYEREQATVSEAINQARSKEVAQEQARLEEFANNAANEMQKKQIDVMTPILNKVQEAINAVAKEKGINYVFDTAKSGGVSVIIYEEGGVDLLPDVKKKLNIQ